jgi:DNA-directed RNA polymerase specialized sigma24 family protein
LLKSRPEVQSQNLPQLYRFCFLMTADPEKAQAAFRDTVREAAFRSAQGEPPNDRLWFYREARWRCLAAGEQGLQAETGEAVEEADLSEEGPEQLEHLDPEQLAVWISGAPDPQRSALALYYLDEFSLRELLALLGMRMTDLGAMLEQGRRQLQAWLHAHVQY